MEVNTTFLTNRSAVETDDTCGMKFYWSQKWGGKGIIPVVEAEALKVGRVIHEDLSEMSQASISVEALEERIQEILSPITEEDKNDTHQMELLYRRLGWMVAWALYMEPRLRDRYETVSVEKELILDRTPLWVAVTPDRVLRDKRDGKLVYMEYKSTVSAGPKWLSSWHFSIQLHLGMAAIAEETGEEVKHGQIVGLQKGYYSQTDRLLRHPCVWAYHNMTTNEWTHDYMKARSASWQPAPVWDYPGGLVEWVRVLGEDVAISQFPMTAPIYLNSRMVDEWVGRRIAREQQIRLNLDKCHEDEMARGIVFEKRTARCRPAWGDPCPYTRLCWNRGASLDPLRLGDFVRRVPHHDVELEWEEEL